MPHFVYRSSRKAIFFLKPSHLPRNTTRAVRSAIGFCNYVFAKCTCLILPEAGYQFFSQYNCATLFSRFKAFFNNFVSRIDTSIADTNSSSVQINILPSEFAQFAQTQPGRKFQQQNQFDILSFSTCLSTGESLNQMACVLQSSRLIFNRCLMTTNYNHILVVA